MSERAAAAGNLGPPHVLTHKDKTYTIRPVLSEGVMLAVEDAMYNRELKPLMAQREAMHRDDYNEELRKLRKRHADGEFTFENKVTQGFLKTKSGALLLLSCVLDAPPAEMLELLAERSDDIHHMLEMVVDRSFPKGKPQARRPKVKKRRRR